MSASNDKNVVPPSKYKPTQLPILTTFSVYTGWPIVIFAFSHKACILTEHVFSEQGFPVFRRRWERVKKTKNKTLCHILAVKTCSPLLVRVFFLLVMPVRCHHRGMLTNDIRLFFHVFSSKTSCSEKLFKGEKFIDSFRVYFEDVILYLSCATGGCPAYVSCV